METSPEEFGSGKQACSLPIWDCGSSLYDSHELVSIVYTIERHMMVWPKHGGLKPTITQLYDPEEVTLIQCASKGTSMVPSSSEIFMESIWLKKKLTRKGIKKKHKKIKCRFFGSVCGGNIF
jgi:hypothetical protein